ncbi:Carbohydrate acetyl esterase/feruloyl esterase precursor [Thalassoglobus neptunius]|uniref:Carbohydrate acetyl esterase/feruloyl esterase n=1 Tax=Thalassoglobus neptunius TaxID=1938619 RepID=A0A5C5V8U8_9PLAN|nr:alpha/beta hydrolase-fold protein [Thalassoglobus neptunius]TWT35016.1 Carbohydrate acetyl esterase/feruloyl esterase precursor [Thalassoglobus neptunius]
MHALITGKFRSLEGSLRLLRLGVLALMGFIALSTFDGEEGVAQSSRFAPPIESPEIGDDGRVTFRIRAEKADSVRLTSSDIPNVGRGVEMKENGESIWEVTVGPVPSGAYRYRFDLDGVAVNDPVNNLTSESNSSTSSLLIVPGSSWMDVRDVEHGSVADVTYQSSSLGRARRMHVYTPPGYERGTDEQYPVFYLLHGATDSDDSWTSVGRASFILDNLIASGHAEPMIVVMPNGHTGRFQFRRDGLRMDEFTRDFEEDIVPFIESHYRVKSGPEHRAISGLSMGGAQTLNIVIRNLEGYGYVGVFSSGVFGITNPQPEENSGPSWEEQHLDVLDDASAKEHLQLVWFAIGKEDFLLETSRATVAMLKKHGFDVIYEETDGGHVWKNWREYLHTFAQNLFRENDNPVTLDAESTDQ